MTSTKIGQLFVLSYTKPLSTGGAAQPGAQMYFYQTGAYTTQQTVYADAGLTTPLTQPIVADAYGRFVPVYMNPALLYSWQMLSSASVLLQQADPVNFLNVSLAADLVKAADTARNNTTVLANDPDLTYAVPAAGTYRIEIDAGIYGDITGTTPGAAFEVNYSGTLNSSAGNTLTLLSTITGSTTIYAIALNTPYAALNLNSSGPGGNGAIMRIAGTIQVTSAGTLSFQWAQNVSSGQNTHVAQGSSMTVTRLG